MPDDSKTASSNRYALWPRNGGHWAAYGLIVAIVGSAAVCFAYIGGLFSPGLLTQAKIVDTFQEVNGIHEGFRRNHTKGVCVSGYFESNGAGARLSRAALFAPGRIPVIGRFAVAVGKPFVPDNQTEVRSMALAFRPARGEEWRTGMNDIPVFSVPTAEAFWEQLRAMQPDPATGQPDPATLA